MGAVGYTSSVSERDYHLAEQAREAAEIDATPEAERQEIRDIYAAKGFAGDLLDRVVDTITANRDRWLATVMDEELHLQRVQTPDITRSAVVITIATLRPPDPAAAVRLAAPDRGADHRGRAQRRGAVRSRCLLLADPGRGLAQERAEDGRDRARRRRHRLRDRQPVPHRRSVMAVSSPLSSRQTAAASIIAIAGFILGALAGGAGAKPHRRLGSVAAMLAGAAAGAGILQWSPVAVIAIAAALVAACMTAIPGTPGPPAAPLALSRGDCRCHPGK
jgi:VIT family